MTDDIFPALGFDFCLNLRLNPTLAKQLYAACHYITLADDLTACNAFDWVIGLVRLIMRHPANKDKLIFYLLRNWAR